MIDSRYFTPLLNLDEWEQTPKGILAEVDGWMAKVECLKPSLFRVEIWEEGRSYPEPQHAVIKDLSELSCPFEVAETPDTITLQTEEAILTVHRAPFALVGKRADGSVFLDTRTEGGLGAYSFINDTFAVSRGRCQDEIILGLGEKTGPMNRNGKTYMLWNMDVLSPGLLGELNFDPSGGDPKQDPTSTVFDPYYISIPFYQSVDIEGRATASFIDNVRRAHYDFSQEGRTEIRFEGGRYAEFFFAGPDLKQILFDYTELTGRIQAPPLWALGYHHCRWAPYHQDDVLAKAKTYREKNLPCDSFWLDIDHMEGYRVFTWNSKLFPRPTEMLSSLKEMGFRCVTIIDPGVKHEPGYSVFDSGLAKGVFCRTDSGAVYQGQVWPGRTAFPDFVNPDARSWWGDYNAKHVEFGLAGIWNDMNEPATGDIPPYGMRFGSGRYSHEAYHNAYALLMAMGTVEGLRKAMPDKRTFVLSRAGSAGIQRYAANWLGDNMSRWDHLEMSVTMSLGMGLSGQAFVGADIGGFCEQSNGELLARWYQAACLAPFCRNHCDAASRDQYPWSFGPEIEEVCREALHLRYRLMPYLYTAFVQAAETGLPVMRPMILDYPEFGDCQDQYMLGDSLLVAPVMQEGVRGRTVTFPAGEWFSFWDETIYQGTCYVQAPLSQIPLFIKAGSVVPMWQKVLVSTLGYREKSPSLRICVPSEDGVWTSVMVEDDGETLGWERGERLVTCFILTRQGNSLKLEVANEGVPDPGFIREGYDLEVVGGDGATLSLG